MKYESSILKRLIDTYGVIGNPRYLSEIIKEFIVRGKELYPQLFTYQSDWLAHIDEFGLTPEYTVSYTGQHIYAPNTKEKPVKSAILNGQTLVNLVPKQIIDYTATSDWDGFKAIGQNSATQELWRVLQDLKPNTKYFISCYVETFNVGENQGYLLNNSAYSTVFDEFLEVKATGLHKWVLTSKSEFTEQVSIALRCQNKNARGAIKIRDIMIVEYQQGMENWDIPYFEGMQSVKMPVLTTSNEDGTKTNILTVNEEVILRSNGSVYDELDLLTGKLTQRIDEDGSVLTQEVVKTVALTIHDKDHQKVERLTSFEGGTHFTTSSQDGSLLPTLTVDVVTDLEKTMVVCSLEGNTM